MSRLLTPDELLAGAAATHEVEVPARLYDPEAEDGPGGAVTLRPLTLRDVQSVARAAKGDGPLTGLLMIRQALVEPSLSMEQISALPAGLVQYLLARVNEISGLAAAPDDLDAAVRDPMTRACFVLAREFGWTAAQCSELTVGQVLMYLEMLGRGEAVAAEPRREGSAA